MESMQDTQNPLFEGENVRIYHVLIAFKYTRDAENIELEASKLKVGDIVKGKQCQGEGVVLVNDFTDKKFSISEAMWDYNYAPTGQFTNTITSNGYIDIVENVSGKFSNFLVNDVLEAIDERSISNLVYALYIYVTPSNFRDTEEGIITPTPLIFQCPKLVNTMEAVSSIGNTVRMHLLNSSNSVSLMPNINKVYQTTISNINNEANNTIKNRVRIQNSGISTRSEDNSKLNSLRDERVTQYKRMYTLQDAMQSFVQALNDQAYNHENQLQIRLSSIKDNYKRKFDGNIREDNVQQDDFIPIKFELNLDDIYKNYEIDNIHFPFEQSDVKRDLKGIKSFPLEKGTTILEAVHEIMKLSSQVGKDALQETPLFYKVVMPSIKDCDGLMKVTIKIRQYTLPYNIEDEQEDTGEIEINDRKLNFSMNSSKATDINIKDIESRILSFTNNIPSEKVDVDHDIITYGDVEQPTMERNPRVKFNENFYNGFRSISKSAHKNYGLNNMNLAEAFDNIYNSEATMQDSVYHINIQANPILISDLNRMPSDVANDVDELSQLYDFTEWKPFYVKLSIYQKRNIPTSEMDEDIKHYYDANYHVMRVVNYYTNGQYVQRLDIGRTDNHM